MLLRGRAAGPSSRSIVISPDNRRTREVGHMQPIRSIEELTRRNVAIIAEMEKAAAHVQMRGDRLADLLAALVGSWTFIIAQSVILLVWIILNITAWIKHWDPYPFILLNLALSLQSAYAAPILMISQNRQAKLSDRRNHLDLQINMLAEQETTEILRILRLLCEHSGVRIGKSANGRAFEEETRPAEIVRQIQGEIEDHPESTDVAGKGGDVGGAAIMSNARVGTPNEFRSKGP